MGRTVVVTGSDLDDLLAFQLSSDENRFPGDTKAGFPRRYDVFTRLTVSELTLPVREAQTALWIRQHIRRKTRRRRKQRSKKREAKRRRTNSIDPHA
jgi:hypothetical protein